MLGGTMSGLEPSAQLPEELAPAASPPEKQRKRLPAWAWLVIALGLLLVAALIAATVYFLMPSQGGASDTAEPKPSATQSTPSKTPKPSTSTTPSPLPSATPAAPVTLPGCSTLLPERYARAADLAARWPSSEIKYNDFGDHRFAEHFGPAAQAALGSATKMIGCGYPASMETYTHLYVSELPAPARQTFIDTLRADGDFVEQQMGKAQVFVWQAPVEGGHWTAAYTAHAFVGDVWVAGYGSDPVESYMPTVLDAILAANPTLQ